MDEKKILIVDDEAVRIPTLRKFLHHILPRDDDYVVHHELTMPSSFAGYDYICLDHDLGVQDVYVELKKMLADQIGLGTFIVHSANPIGAKNIENYLLSLDREVYVVSFPQVLDKVVSLRIPDYNQIGRLDNGT